MDLFINNVLTIDNSITGIRELKKVISKYCNNIKKLCINNSNRDNSFYNDNDLKVLFTSNKNLRCIYFEKIIIDGSCLENLPIPLLEEIELIRCEINSLNYFYSLLSKVKNLKKFNLISNLIDLNDIEIYDALMESNCDSLIEFSLRDNYYTHDYCKKFFSMQKSLRKVDLSHISAEKELFNSLSKDSIEVITHLQCYEKDLHFLYEFSKLRTMSVYVPKLTENYFNIVSDIINIKYIKILGNYNFMFMCFLSNDKDSFLTHLQNLDQFSVLRRNKYRDMNIDCLLKIITTNTKISYKHIENLNIAECLFTIEGVNCIKKLFNLKYLNIAYNDNVTDSWLIMIIQKLQKLEKIFVFHCPLITNEAVTKINEIKKKRKDIHKLEIFIFETKITKNDFVQDDNFMVVLNDTSKNLRI